MFNFIIVGSGFTGSILARMLAQDLNQKVLVLEKRAHIAGNMYDEIDEKSGILVQRYGPHTFVTDSLDIVNFIKRFDVWHDFFVKVRVEIDGKLMPIPFNFKSIELFYPEDKAKNLINKLKKEYSGLERVPVFMLSDHQDPMIREFGELLYEKDYIPYTSKQWGLPPEKIDRSILARVKFALSYDDVYMQQKYQLMPSVGFTEVFNNILDHTNIEVRTNIDALAGLVIDYENHTIKYDGINEEIPLIFTGPIDELFGLKFGRLPYRSLNIEYTIEETDYLQEVPIITYPQALGKTRSTEYKQITGQVLPGKTLIAVESPVAYDPKNKIGNIPYYPVINDQNMVLYNRYRELAQEFKKLIVCGRLGDYKYYNMDAAINRALEIFNEIKDLRVLIS